MQHSPLINTIIAHFKISIGIEPPKQKKKCKGATITISKDYGKMEVKLFIGNYPTVSDLERNSPEKKHKVKLQNPPEIFFGKKLKLNSKP